MQEERKEESAMVESEIRKKESVYKMRLDRQSWEKISRELKVSQHTINRWENGYIDSQGIRHRGWKEKLIQGWLKREEEEINCGLMIRNERLMAYRRLAQMAVKKIEGYFKNIQAERATDIKALLPELRELYRLISAEKEECKRTSHNREVRVDITLEEVQERYRRAHLEDREEAGEEQGSQQD